MKADAIKGNNLKNINARCQTNHLMLARFYILINGLVKGSEFFNGIGFGIYRLNAIACGVAHNQLAAVSIESARTGEGIILFAADSKFLSQSARIVSQNSVTIREGNPNGSADADNIAGGELFVFQGA